MSEQVAGRQYGWPGWVVAAGAMILALGLVAWMMSPVEWASVARFLLLLPAGLVAYRFGRRAAWCGAAVGVLLILLSLIGSFSTAGLTPELVTGLLAGGLLFPITLWAAGLGERRRPGITPIQQLPS